MKRLAIAAILGLLAGCGYPGPPLPPALNIPKQISDFRADQTGDWIFVRFTLPVQTTENLAVGELQAITLYAGPDDGNFNPEAWGAAAVRYQIPAGATEYSIPVTDWVGRRIILTVRTTGPSGRDSDYSNFSFLNVGAPLAMPSSVSAKNVEDGVALTWIGNAPRYQVLRAIASNPDAEAEPLAEVERAEFLDNTTVYGARYRYTVLGLDGETRRSLPSEPVEITTVDTFPPTIPTELTAVAGPASIDLSWVSSVGEGLAGYDIFRAAGDGAFERIDQRIAVPAYTDRTARPGQPYRYKVSAIDTAGNESDPSAEASARIDP